MEHNARLKALRLVIYEKTKVEKAILELQTQIEPLISKEKKLRNKRQRHEAIVEDLEKTSLETIILRLFNAQEKRYQYEKQEADQVILKHELVYQDLKMLEEQLTAYKSQLETILSSEEEYQQLIKEKEAWVRKHYPNENKLILKVEEEIGSLDGQMTEIEEAKIVGKKALKTCKYILDALDSSALLGTMDVFNTGSDLAKYSVLNDVREMLDILKRQLSRFKTELVDVSIDETIRIQINDFTFIADFFFDNFFSELAFLDGVDKTQKQVVSIKQKIKDVMKQLDILKNKQSSKIEIKKKEIENIVYNIEQENRDEK